MTFLLGNEVADIDQDEALWQCFEGPYAFLTYITWLKTKETFIS